MERKSAGNKVMFRCFSVLSKTLSISVLELIFNDRGNSLKRTLSQRIEVIPSRIWDNKFNMLIVMVWSLFIAIICVIQYDGWVAIHNGKVSPFNSWSGPVLSTIDVVAIVLASVIFGALLSDIVKVLIGEISALAISTAIATGYVTNFIWLHTNINGLATSIVLSSNYGWSWAVYWGFLNVFRELFPVGFGMVFFCGFIGAILRTYFGYS